MQQVRCGPLHMRKQQTEKFGLLNVADMPTNILNLPAYTITAFQKNDHDYPIDAVTRQEPVACPHCRHDSLEGFGRREQMVKDFPCTASHLIRPRGVIANIANNAIVELLRNRNKDTLVHYLHHLEHKDQVQYVAMDMWQPYRDACQAVIPDAQIVIDKFHVLRMANDALERVRKSLRESLTPN